jgi:hypothetical protein
MVVILRVSIFGRQIIAADWGGVIEEAWRFGEFWLTIS